MEDEALLERSFSHCQFSCFLHVSGGYVVWKLRMNCLKLLVPQTRGYSGQTSPEIHHVGNAKDVQKVYSLTARQRGPQAKSSVSSLFTASDSFLSIL